MSKQLSERQDALGELSAQSSPGDVGFGEPVSCDRWSGALGDLVGRQGAERGGLVQGESAVVGGSEAAVGRGAGGGVQGQEPDCGVTFPVPARAARRVSMSTARRTSASGCGEWAAM
ncbi:hypothetical protein AAW14_31985 [Streptomyces hygroscopicus]|uniref:hypothetical protein n=1 Tax=Streptomyces hygroscopicus TaxID=1912 RepID=UPI0022403E68|nr:hypothetical protein [Streptomyces hygroscopicus]MCW7946486.1 hypothetical protein [Streptomyces hygroscopicus]